MRLDADTVVIGAGVVGLATARALAQSGRDVLVLEQHDTFGTETSSRNSEVIHAGIYYPTGSLKARLCVAGRRSLYSYCESHAVPYRRCGKWLVATDQSQFDALASLKEKAAENDVGLTPLSTERLASIPALSALGGLESPETGIVDSHQLMLALVGDLEDAGGRVVYRAPVEAAQVQLQGNRLRVGGDLSCEVDCRQVVNAAGLHGIALAQQWIGFPRSRIPTFHLARGHYFSYSGRHPFEHLIYPLPEPGGLGVHLTLDLAGQARFGPDVQWVDQLDYRIPADCRQRFVASIQRWWPTLKPSRLQPAYSGIRPKLSGPGEAAADFHIEGPEEHGIAGLVQLFGIESPGLTACLAIADLVRQKLDSGRV